MLHMHVDCNLRSLTTLGLHLRYPSILSEREMYQNGLGRFLKGLLPLHCLELVSEVNRAIFLIVLRMATTGSKRLCHLYDTGSPRQSFIETHDEVESLRSSFPYLEELLLKIIRSRRNAHEVAVYKALGSMPKPRKLSLTLWTAGLEQQAPRSEI